MRNATAPRPIRATSAPNPGVVVGGTVVGTVVGGVVGGAVVGGAVVGTVVGTYSTTLKSVVAVMSCAVSSPIAEAVTMYSSGLKVVVSTGKDHVLKPWVPWTTFTVPEDPLNSPLVSLGVGPKEEEIRPVSRTPAARHDGRSL